MKPLLKTEVLTAVAKTIKGTSFVGLRNYTNKQGEKSNQTILAGYSHEKALECDFLSLQENKDKIFAELEKSHAKELIQTAFDNVFKSLETRLSSDEVKAKLREENNPTLKASDAQANAYIHLAKGVKLCKETDEIHVFGLVVKKSIIEAIEYKPVNSRELTIVQNKIKKICNFKQDKIRTFIFIKSEVQLQGITIK
jgi:hypothetical protein